MEETFGRENARSFLNGDRAALEWSNEAQIQLLFEKGVASNDKGNSEAMIMDNNLSSEGVYNF